MKSFVRSLLVVILSCSGAFAQTQGAPPGTGLESGGLAPPPAIESTPAEGPPSATEQELDRAEREDSGRGLEFFWINAEVGVTHLGLQTLSGDALVDPDVTDTTHTGVLYGGGLGLRLLVFTVGARFRFANFSEARIWSIDGEGGMHIPLGSLEPYFTLRAGYTRGSFDVGDCGGCETSALDVKGFNVRPAVGLDVYLSNMLSIGGNLSGDFLFLSRSAVPASELGTLDPAVYGKDGSGIGAGVTLSAVVGLHF